jgi:hypothetical protein
MSIQNPNDPIGGMTDGRDDPNRGPLDRATNALDGRDDPNKGPLDRATNALDGRDDPNKGPVDRAENAIDGRDDPNRGPLDRAANLVTGESGGIANATGGTSGSTYGTSSASGGKASAVFDTQEDAQRAVEQLRSAGIDDAKLSLIAQSGRTTTTTAGDGALVDEDHGSIIRGILGGGALGAGLGIAALAIPGVGPLVAAGAIASSAIPGAAALGAAVGAAAGTINEVLNSHGVSEEDSSYYSDRIQQGGTFVSVDSSDSGVDIARAQEILYSCGGHSASSSKAI